MAERGPAALKRRAEALLRADDFADRLALWHELPARRVVKPLLSFLCHGDELLKWRAVTALGLVVSQLANADMESARTVMRQLMWTLTDESGGIGWGVPEAMGEIMAAHQGLAVEFSHILVAYIREEGNSLENPLLQRGVLWGLARLAQVHPHLLADAGRYVAPFLRSEDAALRGLASWVTASLGEDSAPLRALLDDETELLLYVDGQLKTCRVRELASRRTGPP